MIPKPSYPMKPTLHLDRVTRRFFDAFWKAHAAFLSFIDGIPVPADREWYASVMLNRLMFVYFIQKQGFLDGDDNYLANRLQRIRQKGADKFHTFYRLFLRRLFHEGLGKPKDRRAADLIKLVGNVPYLNGGIFDEHELEQAHPDLHIPDAAFETIFSFFNQYQWHLDDRPLQQDNEINPDVLGYIFEKYINQKQMGAYYTKEDITEYIARNTIVPFLLAAAARACPDYFQPDGPAWSLLRLDPDAYLFAAVRHGVDLPLPPPIAAGLDDVAARTDWNKPAAVGFALPTETWREHVARRRRCLDLREKLRAGEVAAVNDLITYNLDIRRFTEDVLRTCEDADVLRAFWQALTKVSVLDPTCGSGAFLFAALNVLEQLYNTCLDRMQDLLDAADQPHFRQVLDQIQAHHNRHYLVLKSIIVHNLYGVDVMREAVEICKLRLFLKLVAQLIPGKEPEPLPDIDFNVRAGNTLIGFVNEADLERAMRSSFKFDDELITAMKAELRWADEAFQCFHKVQLAKGNEAGDLSHAKAVLRQRLDRLREKLDNYLATQYEVDTYKVKALTAWKISHQPFHWFAEFYAIMNAGGFDVIIGNPPYVETSDVADQYSIRFLKMMKTGNLFSVCLERFFALEQVAGRFGVIVPLSAACTPRMLPLMKLLGEVSKFLCVSNFAVRPAKLFVGVDMNLTIFLGEKWGGTAVNGTQVISTTYNRWQADFRPFLFDTLAFQPTRMNDRLCSIFKIGTELERKLLGKMLTLDNLESLAIRTLNCESIFYHSGGRYFRKCLRERLSNEYIELKVKKGFGDVAICLLSSSIYYWFWIAVSDCYHVTKGDIHYFPVPPSLVEEKTFSKLAEKLLTSLWENSVSRMRNRADGTKKSEVNFDVAKSKPLIDQIDGVLARHYGFTEEELDFVLNFDVKFRSDDEV